ncbi:GxxExxY protein [bacterium]|nr:MAG: GxxExxY protein [bacterium]
MTENEVAAHIVDACYHVHSALGPGLLESVYQATLAYELGKRGLSVVSQHGVPVVYEDVRLDLGFRLDLLAEDCVIVEIKSIDALADVHFKQVLTYLKLSDRRLGILVNFNVPSLEGNIRRIVNRLTDS